MTDPNSPPPVDPGQETPGAPPETPLETPPESPVLPPETPVETPPAEAPLTPEDEAVLHKMQSWQGRRDVDLRAEMDRRDQALIGQIREMIPAAAAPVVDTPDPATDANAWFEHKLGEKVKSEQDYNQTLISTGQAILNQDPLVKADPKMADEIYQEIQSGRVPVNRQLDAGMAANIAIAQAKANIFTRRMTTPANPLQTNTPATVPVGGVTPPATPPVPAVKVPEMTDMAKQAAARWNYTDKEVAKILK